MILTHMGRRVVIFGSIHVKKTLQDDTPVPDIRPLHLLTVLLKLSVSIGDFVTGLGQISPFPFLYIQCTECVLSNVHTTHTIQ